MRGARSSQAAYPGDLLQHLESFAELATRIGRGEGGAFPKAAGALAVDVSVLRRRLQTLSAYVGAPLVEGRGTTLRLTKAGDRVRASAARVLDATGELRSFATDDEGPLRVACTGTILAEVLPPVLRTMRGEFPRLAFRVRRAGGEASRALLAKGEVDFAVVRATSRPEGLHARRIGSDRLWLVAPAKGALATATRLSPEKVAREPLVGYSKASSTMRRVLDVLEPLGASPWIEVDGKVAAMSYVAAGLGIAFVSALEPQKPERAGVVARDVTAWFAPVSFWLVWNEGEASARGRAARGRGGPPWASRFVELASG
ncbi:MAG: hypothetical protein JST00_24305 [Deltaproteobacteria bacterium]|nr:hypothetical protein [Deltaproteobacteria bacterium]